MGRFRHTHIFSSFILCVLINEILFELRAETILILMIFAVIFYYLSSSEWKAWKIQAWTGLEPWPPRCRCIFMSTGIQENFFLFKTDFSISYHEKWKSLADSSRCRFFLSCHLCDKDKNTMHYDLSTQRPHADPHWENYQIWTDTYARNGQDNIISALSLKDGL